MKRTLFDTCKERLAQYQKANNMRNTAVRLMVLEAACNLRQPFTAEQLATACLSERISTGTIYNALEVFVSAQILHATTRQRGQTATEYEIISGTQTHMQLVCEKCGRVAEFHDKAIDRLVRERGYSNFNLQRFSLFVYGECKYCRQRHIK